MALAVLKISWSFMSSCRCKLRKWSDVGGMLLICKYVVGGLNQDITLHNWNCSHALRLWGDIWESQKRSVGSYQSGQTWAWFMFCSELTLKKILLFESISIHPLSISAMFIWPLFQGDEQGLHMRDLLLLTSCQLNTWCNAAGKKSTFLYETLWQTAL